MIADMSSDKKKLSSIVTGLYLKGRKLNISLVFITHTYFTVLKTKTKCNKISS